MNRSRSFWPAACSPRPGSSRSRNRPLRVPDFGQRGEKGEEPGEALRALAEVERDAMALIANANLDEGPSCFPPAAGVDVENRRRYGGSGSSSGAPLR